jgi:acyl-homoserine-lactone acylase
MRDRKAAIMAAAVVAVAVMLLALAARSGAPGNQAHAAAGPPPSGSLHATIRRTTHGIPHILADDFAGLGYGYGYSLAQDNLCVVAEGYVTVRGERSRYFGPDGSYEARGNGSINNNLDSDFFYRRIIDNKTIENLLTLEPPRGANPQIKELVRGYTAGYNRYLGETGVDNLSDPNCRGAAWVKPISEMDVYRRFYQLGLLASAGVAIDGIGEAQPPTAPLDPPNPAAQQEMIATLKQQLPLGGIGSNAVGLGKDATDNGKGMMLGNPHFPWDGTERFYEAQLTIPGSFNVEGGSLFGVPLVLIGHNDALAWSHTVSTAYRFTPFEEKLVPGSPTTYLQDGQPKEMRRDTVTVQVKNADGSLSDRTRTLYSTQHGPVFNSLLGQDLFPWTPASAYALGDANATNFRYLNHFFETDQAHSVTELDQVLKRNQGIPWVNTLAADSSGKAYYADISVVPNVSNQKAAVCNTALGAATFQALRLPVLDGSRSACEWDNDPDAVEPGIFGPSHLPTLFRDDYVENSNDSYWLANPEQPLTGFAKIIGDEDTERALRTRSGLTMIRDRLAGTDGRPGNRFTLQQLQDTVFANQQYAGQLWRDQLVQMCQANPTLPGSNGPVDVSAACPVLAAWDLHDNLDSNGALLFRRFASRALAAVGLSRPPGIFAEEYTPGGDPVNTPRGLNTANPRVQQALADAVTDLRSSGIPLDAPLRGYQFERRNGEAVPIHGGPGTLGVFNAVNVGWVPGQGYPNVPHGSSYVYATQFTDGCPETRSILTYSLSTDPTSPYFADQTRMFSNKQWVDEAFCENEIAADPNLRTTEISEATGYPRPRGASPLYVPLVPAFDACTAPNETHAPPLAFGSCRPAAASSPQLTVGTPDANGKPANSSGFARFRTVAGDPATPADEADVGITFELSDVRRSADLSDYTGELQGAVDVRATDRSNGATGSEAATMTDYTLSASVPCVPTGAGDIGALCSVTTSADTLLPGSVSEGARGVWELGQVQVRDGTGAPFAVQGVFAP